MGMSASLQSLVRIHIATGTLLFLVGGCSSSQLVGVKVAKGYEDAHYSRILVISIGKRPEVTSQFEDQFVRALAERKVGAVAGFIYLPRGQQADQAAVQDAIAKSDAQAVIITRLVKMQDKTSVSANSVPSFNPAASDAYSTAWSGYYDPPQTGSLGNPENSQVYVDTIAYIETNLIDAKTGDTAWTARTRTFGASDWERQMPGLVKLLVDELAKSGEI